MDISNQERERELLYPTSEHFTAIRYQQGRPVGFTVPYSGRPTAYVEHFVHVSFRNHSVSWAHLPYVLVRNTQFGVYPFRFKVYVHCINCDYGNSSADSKDNLYTFFTLCLRVMFTFYMFFFFFFFFFFFSNTISYQVAAGQIHEP